MATKQKTKRVAGRSIDTVSNEDLQRLKQLSQRIKGARLARGFKSAAACADSAGVTRQYLSNVEKRQSVRPEAMPMLKLARALNVTMDWLLTGEGLPNGSALEILPHEFDLLEALRRAELQDRKTVEHVLRPYLKTFGKPPKK